VFKTETGGAGIITWAGMDTGFVLLAAAGFAVLALTAGFAVLATGFAVLALAGGFVLALVLGTGFLAGVPVLPFGAGLFPEPVDTFFTGALETVLSGDFAAGLAPEAGFLAAGFTGEALADFFAAICTPK
jgi:hypothetical protein